MIFAEATSWADAVVYVALIGFVAFVYWLLLG